MKVTARARNWTAKRYLGPFNRECEFVVPDEIADDEVEVTAEGCDDLGQPLEPPLIVKAAIRMATNVLPKREAVAPADSNPALRSKHRRRKSNRRQDEAAQEERPSDQPLRAGYAGNNERDAE